MESEKLIERKLGEKIKALGGWSIKLLPTFIAGLPDRLCLLPGGVVFFVETKSTGEKLRPVQRIVRNKLIRLGFKVYIIDSSDGLNELIKEYENTV